MLETAPQLTTAEFSRLTPAEVKPFRGAQTAQVTDALGGRGALDYRIKPLFSDQSTLCGTALTCDAGAADNYGVAAAIDRAQAGDIIVCATGGHLNCAVVGDLVMATCRNAGVAGFITDGAVRDTRGIRNAGLPCFAAGVSPNSPAVNGPASVGLPIIVGGVSVCAGDLVIADEDGVVIVPAARVQETTVALAEVLRAEKERLEQIMNGRKSMF